MIISNALKGKLERSMSEHPLQVGERRGIEGDACHYFSLSEEDNGKKPVVSTEIGGVTVYVYAVTVDESAK